MHGFSMPKFGVNNEMSEQNDGGIILGYKQALFDGYDVI